MKSMTDFIMEQEQPAVVTESYTDADLVSDYMSLCAASANMACIYECATIVEFCQANDIAIPETLVQEGFSEVMSNIWKGIAKFFETIAEWFRGLVQKTSSVVAKAKLQETIAKLKQRKGEALSQDMINSASYLKCTYDVLINGLESFRSYVLHELAENAAYTPTTTDGNGGTQDTEEKKFNEWLTKVDNITADFLFFSNKKNFISAAGEVKKIEPSSLKSDTFDATKLTGSAADDVKTTDDLVNILEEINSRKIPETGTKLLKAIDADTKKFKAVQALEKTVIDDSETESETTITQTNAAKYNKGNKPKIGAKVIVGSIWVTSDKTTKQVKDCADALAKAYDSVTKSIVEISTKEYKDLEVSKDDKKQYEKDLAAANKDKERYDFDKSLKLK